jgi:hypothetical protein
MTLSSVCDKQHFGSAFLWESVLEISHDLLFFGYEWPLIKDGRQAWVRLTYIPLRNYPLLCIITRAAPAVRQARDLVARYR